MPGFSALFGWISSKWQKQPIILGFSSTKSQSTQTTNIPTTSYTMTGAACPAGEIWIMRALAIAYLGTPPSNMRVDVTVDAVSVPILRIDTVVNNTWYSVLCDIVLAKDDAVSVAVEGATVTDNLYMRWLGIQVDIDQ